MSDSEQTKAFADELDNLVERYRSEFDITFAQVVGVLHMKAFLLCEEASNRDPDEDEPEIT